MDPDTALSVRGVSMRFGGVRALVDVSLSLTKGHVLGLVGQNGAGKSTLMKILNGQYPYGSFDGEVIVGGVPVRLHSPRDAAKYGIGIVPQETSVVETLTVGENVHLGQYGRRFLTVGGLQRSAQEFLDDIGLPLDARRVVGGLTTSEKQLVMIARTLYAKPRVLILDEPTTALTEAEVDRLFSVVRSMSEHGVSTVLISHRLDEIFELADEVAVLRDGRLVAQLERSQFDRERIVNEIAGRAIDDVFPRRVRSSSTEPVLEIRDLTVADARSSERNIVDGISLTVNKGEVVGIGGALGSGRTELLEAIFGLRRPSSGTVSLAGRQLPQTTPGKSINDGIGFVPEDRKSEGLYFNGTVEDNLTLAALPALKRLVQVDFTARRRLASTQMTDFTVKASGPTASIGSLSGGNQQKVLIARAAAGDPLLLLLDEPTKGVDVGAKSDIYHLIAQAAQSGTSVLMVSSEVPELIGLCDRIVVLAAGRIAKEIEANQASEADLLAAAMTGRLDQSEGAR